MTSTSDPIKTDLNRLLFLEYLNENNYHIKFIDFACEAVKGGNTNPATMPIGVAMLTPKFFVFLTDYQGSLGWKKVFNDAFSVAAPYLSMVKWLKNPYSFAFDIPKIFKDKPNFLEKALSSPNSFFIKTSEISEFSVEKSKPFTFHILDKEGGKFSLILGEFSRPAQERSAKDWASLIGKALIGYISIEYETYKTDKTKASIVLKVLKELSLRAKTNNIFTNIFKEHSPENVARYVSDLIDKYANKI
jgi:hypothetical protein